MPAKKPGKMLRHDLVPATETGDENPLDLAQDVFVRYGQRFVLYSSHHRGPLSPEQWERLLESGRRQLYVRRANLAEALRDLAEDVANMLADPGLCVSEKYLNLYSTTAAALGEVFEAPPTNEAIEALVDYVAATAPYIASSLSTVASLQQLAAHDYTTYAHSASVYIHAVALGAWLRVGDEATLRTLGLGAILHDIGKTQISTDILQKPGPLSPAEWKDMQRHPTLGVKLLREAGGIPAVAQTLVVQHHERLDGSGYPRGIPKSAIHPLTNIIMVVDMYDALTKARTYRPAYTPFKALKLIKEQTANRIDVGAYRGLVLMLAGS